MILVTGATGTIGSEVVRQLIAAGQKPRLLVRNPEKLKNLDGKVEVVKGDLGDSGSVARALEGIDKVFLLTAGLDGPRLESAMIDAAQKAGVKHVVKLSVMGADFEAISFGKWHRANEKKLEASGLGWTFLRPGSFVSNALWWAETIKKDGAVYQPDGQGKNALIDPADVAAVAVKVLTTPGHEGKIYTLSGPTAMTTQEVADVIGKVIGRPIKHVDVPPDAARQGMLASGMPEGYVTALLELLAATKAGMTATVTTTVEELLGRKPATVASFIERHSAAFR